MTLTPGEAALAYADSLLTGDFERLVALHHPDLICSLLGDTLVSGRFRGRDDFFAHTFTHVLGKLAPSPEIYLKGHRLVAADDRCAALLLHGGLPTKAGGRYDQNYLQIFRVEDGVIRETHELLDTVMIDTQLYGRQLAEGRTQPVPALRPALMRPVFEAGPGRATVGGVADALSAAMAVLDWDGILATLDEGIVFQVSGTTPMSGIHRGKPWLVEVVNRFHRAKLDLDTLRIVAGPTISVVGEEGFALMVEVAATTTGGADYRQIVGLAAQCRGDRIGELHIYFDTAREEHAIFDNPLAGASQPSPGAPFDIDSHYER